MFKWIDNFLTPYQVSKSNASILDRVKELEGRVAKLEEENIESTNLIYELMNSLDAIDNRIDILMSEPYNLPINAEKLR
jgi:hypothetical protein